MIFVAKKHQITTLEINTERDKEEEEDKDKELLSNNSGVVVLVAFFIFCQSAFEKSFRTLCVVVRTLVLCIRGGPGG